MKCNCNTYHKKVSKASKIADLSKRVGKLVVD